MTTSDRLSQIKARAEKGQYHQLAESDVPFLLELVERYRTALEKIASGRDYDCAREEGYGCIGAVDISKEALKEDANG